MCPLLVVDNQSTLLIIIILTTSVNKNNYHLCLSGRTADVSRVRLLKKGDEAISASEP